MVGEGPAPGPDDLYWRMLRDHGASSWAVVRLKDSDEILVGAPKWIGMSGENRALFLERVRFQDSEFNDKGLLNGPGVIVPLDQIMTLELHAITEGGGGDRPEQPSR
jgi:hypothetical protein